MITRTFVALCLRLMVRRLWRKGLTIEQLRKKATALDHWLGGDADAAPITALDANGVRAEWVGYAQAAERGVLLYLHGGAFSVHLPNAYRQLAHRLAQSTGMRVLVPDYRLAPEHPFPAGLDDCCAVYRWLLAQGLPPERMAIAGDSAGGNLALSVLMRSRDEGLPLPACASLMSPLTDFTGGSPSMYYNEKHDSMFSHSALGLVGTSYLAGAPAAHPQVSPLLGNWQGLPPLDFHASSSEMVLDDSIRAVERACVAGVEARVKVWSDLPHVFQLIRVLPESQQSLDEIGAFIVQHAVHGLLATMTCPVAAETVERTHLETTT